MIRPCPNQITCPGSDSPFQNFSSEAPDTLDFLSVAYQWGSDWGAPPLQQPWTALACNKVFSSSVSPLDAVAQAIAAAALCAFNGTNPNTPPFFNRPVLCGVPVPNGGKAFYTLPAGLIPGMTQDEANTRGQILGCLIANGNPVRLSALTNGCINQGYAEAILPSGGRAPYTFSLVAGSLPPGMIFDPRSAIVSGTPTASGNFSFTIHVVDAAGLAFEETYNFPVLAITNSTVLPVPQQGSSYFASLLPDGGSGPYTFFVDPSSNPLPAGIGLNSNGQLTGVPTTTAPINVVVDMTDGGGNSCLFKVTSLNACALDFACLTPWVDGSQTVTLLPPHDTASAGTSFNNNVIVFSASAGSDGAGLGAQGQALIAGNNGLTNVPTPQPATCHILLEVLASTVVGGGSTSLSFAFQIQDATNSVTLVGDFIIILNGGAGFTKTYTVNIPANIKIQAPNGTTFLSAVADATGANVSGLVRLTLQTS